MESNASLGERIQSKFFHLVERSNLQEVQKILKYYNLLQKDDKLNVSAFIVILLGMILMSIDFSIAIFFASRTVIQIRKAKSFSFNFRSMQIKIMRALLAQVIIYLFLNTGVK